jgi:PAS domain-containing protein
VLEGHDRQLGGRGAAPSAARLAEALSDLGHGLTASESGLGLLADAYPAPTWVIDAEGRLAWANRAWLAEVKPSRWRPRATGG